MGTKEDRIFSAQIRKACFRQFKARGFGHLGGAMSVAETVAVLFGGAMKIDPKRPDWEDRDWFVLSKGHSGPVLYAALALKGYFPEEALDTLNRNNTTLPSHPDRNKTVGVDVTTGSLGQGISQAAGVALGLKKRGKDSYVYAIVGDGEANEGQVWEAALFAPHQKLDNLIVFLDNNGQQLDGFTEDICSMGDIRQKFAAFGWHAQEIDGHDTDAIQAAVAAAKETTGVPSVIVIKTVKGKGCAPFEGALNNHHINVTAEQMDEGIAAMDREIGKWENA